ncbi:MAG TPA: hypothetical protein VFF29_03815 [Bacteroidota bacterium]|nr:hypothetical protein [Bacteroidota bacterium]
MRKPLRGLIRPLIIVFIFSYAQLALSQKQLLKNFKIGTTNTNASLPPSNSVSQIKISDSVIWLGTNKGLARSADRGKSWLSFRSDSAFTQDGIFAIDIRDDTIWAAMGYEKDLNEGSVQTGSGYAVSTDAGVTWLHVNQPVDQRADSIISYGINDSLRILPVIVPEQNVTFDVSLSPRTTWVASWASGLRKSTDQGQTWQRILLPFDNLNSIRPTDTLWTYAMNDTLKQQRIFQRFDPRRHNNLLAFAVHAVDNDTIWCGTAGGINKSTDGGISWVKFNRNNQASPILGNWVIAIGEQRSQGISRIWTTNWKADDPDEQFGVSYTEDGGRLWKNILHGIRAYDFAFKDSIAYIATEAGIYRTVDAGLSFLKFSTISDPARRQIIVSPKVYTVDIMGDTVWIGTDDGIASTIDNASQPFGSSWVIHRRYQPVGTTKSTYSYPNPFSPNFESVRIHYSTQHMNPNQLTPSQAVSIDIFDYSMNRVRSLINGAQRSSAYEIDELWDGRTDDGRLVANGVYFYRIKIENDEPLFGKIFVLQ